MQYTVYFTATVSTAVTVEADSPDDAEEKAYDQLPSGLCHWCASTINSPGEWDLEDVIADDETDGAGA